MHTPAHNNPSKINQAHSHINTNTPTCRAGMLGFVLRKFVHVLAEEDKEDLANADTPNVPETGSVGFLFLFVLFVCFVCFVCFSFF